MTSQQENSPIDSSIDRRLFLGAAGALTLAAQPALAQGAQTEAKTEAKPADAAKRLSDTIADFVIGFDATTLPPLAVERVRLAFIDTFAVMLAGSPEEGAGLVFAIVQPQGPAPR